MGIQEGLSWVVLAQGFSCGYSPDGGWNLNNRGLARQPSPYCLGASFLPAYLYASWFPLVCILVHGINIDFCLLFALNSLNVFNYLLYILQVMGVKSHHLSIQFRQIHL